PTATPPQTVTGPGVQLRVYGTGFQPGATVLWSGIPMTTVQVSAVELSATVPASRMLTPKTAGISVSNPGGILSVNAVSLPVTVPTTAPGVLNFKPAAAGVTVASNQCWTTNFVVADFNGDGIKDIVCGPLYGVTAGLFLWPGKADGSFGPPETIS